MQSLPPRYERAFAMTEPIQSYSLHLAGVPMLMVSAGAPVAAAKRGTVLFIHGLGADKHVNCPELEWFAGQGFLAIGLDAVGHGERRYGDFAQRFDEHSPDFEQHLIETVVATARELPGFVDLLKSAGLAHEGGVGLFGVSMGGFIAYGAAASGVFDAIAPIIASPLWRSDVPENPSRNLERYFPCAILSQVALRDELVNADEARQFHRLLEPYYSSAPERLSLIEFPESPHFMRDQDWRAGLSNAAAWFRRFLSPAS